MVRRRWVIRVMESNSVATRHTVLGMALIIIVAVWGSSFIYSIHAVMPSSPVSFPFESQISLGTLIPQRWAFFTRPPTEADSIVFEPTRDGGWKQLDLGPSLSDWLGFGRTGLSRSLEMGLLTATEQNIPLSTCEDRIPDCLDRLPVGVQLRNPMPAPFFCGELGIAVVEPLSWDEAKSASSRFGPSQVVRLSVAC